MNTTHSDDSRFDRLEAIIAAGFGGLRVEIADLKTSLNAIYARVDDLHVQIKLVAEGHATLVDSIADLKRGFERLEAGQDHLELRMMAVESRLAS
jgi:UDP-N-acetylglucosamine enolpyruvyl transferase